MVTNTHWSLANFRKKVNTDYILYVQKVLSHFNSIVTVILLLVYSLFIIGLFYTQFIVKVVSTVHVKLLMRANSYVVTFNLIQWSLP